MVRDAGYGAFNGYYAQSYGVYIRQITNYGSILSYTPSAFKVFANLRERKSFTASPPMQSIRIMPGGYWLLSEARKDQSGTALVYGYISAPEQEKLKPEDYLYTPPTTAWSAVTMTNTGAVDGSAVLESLHGPTVHCFGSLADSSGDAAVSNPSNIQLLLQRPVTTCIIIGLLYYGYYLWASHVPVEDVAYSYEAVVNRKELYRVVTASIAHYDLMHIGFNLMAMWQLGTMETVYGSTVFAYLNADLIVVTMAICTAIYHYMIFYGGQPQVASQLSVGWSCVLFAWMVAISVRLSEYCPIFFFPSLCFTTYYIPFVHLPFNLGPFVLLFITKFILPRSSLVGHLSGIIIGYPLAWNMINWMTPTIFMIACVLVYIHVEGLYAWKLPYFNSSNPLNEFVDDGKLWKYFYMKTGFCMICILLPLLVVFCGLSEIFPRAMLVFLCWNAIAGRRTEWLTDQRTANLAAGNMVLLSMLVTVTLALTDMLSVGALAGSWAEVTAVDGSLPKAAIGLTVLCLSFLSAVVYIMSSLASLYDIPVFIPTLQSLYLYSPDTQGFLSRMFGSGQIVVPEMITAATASLSSGSPAYRSLPIEDMSSNGSENGASWDRDRSVGSSSNTVQSSARESPTSSRAANSSARARAAEAALARLTNSANGNSSAGSNKA